MAVEDHRRLERARLKQRAEERGDRRGVLADQHDATGAALVHGQEIVRGAEPALLEVVVAGAGPEIRCREIGGRRRAA